MTVNHGETLNTERDKWIEHLERVYEKHPLYTDVLRAENVPVSELARVELIKNWFDDQERGSIADIGCQDGYFSNLLDRLGYKVTGIDSCTRFINIAKLKYPDVEFVHNCFENLGYENQFDYIICTETLEHVVNPEEFIEAVYKALKPDGKIFISVPLPVGSYHQTHAKTWGRKEFRNFLKKYFLLDELNCTFFHRWNVCVGIKSPLNDIKTEEFHNIMKGDETI